MRGSLIMIVAGIAVGRHFDMPVSNVCVIYVLLALLFFAVLLRRWAKAATVCICGALFVLGIFLIKYSDNRAEQKLHNIGTVERTTTGDRGGIVDRRGIFAEWRSKLSEVYRERGIAGEAYDIVTAMTLGEKRGINKETRTVYSTSGGAHILALSGMHLSILFMIVAFLLPTRWFPRLSAVAEIIIIWAFVALVGFHPSVVRAATMLTIYTIAHMLSRNTRSMDILTATATILLIISPQWLFDIGFQMSFAAMAGILLLYTPTYKFLTYQNNPSQNLPSRKRGDSAFLRAIYRFSHSDFFRACYNIFIGMIVISVTAQLGVAPLVAHYFGNFPTYFIITNFVVTPAAFIIIFFAIGLLIGLPLEHPLTLTIQGMHTALIWITNLPCSSFEIKLSAWQTLLVYIIIIALCRLVHLFVRKTDRFLRAMT